MENTETVKNPAYGHWSEEETNWSDRDTKFVEDTLRQDNNEEIEITYEEIRRKYGTLSAR